MYQVLIGFIHEDKYYNLKKILLVHFSVTKKGSQKLNQYDVFKNQTVVSQLHSIGNVLHFLEFFCFCLFLGFLNCMGIGGSFENTI